MSKNTPAPIAKEQWRRVDRFARRALLDRLQKITFGQLRIVDSDGDLTFGNQQQADTPAVQILSLIHI